MSAAFDPQRRDEITNPNAIRIVNRDADGKVNPYDRTGGDVIYNSEADETLVKE